MSFHLILMSNRVHAIDTLRTRSLLPSMSEGAEEPLYNGEALVVICKPSQSLRSVLRKPGGLKQSKKTLRFQNPIQKTHIVENWKIYNSPYEET